MTIYILDILLSWFGTSLCSMSSKNCCFLTCIHISQEAGHVVWYFQLLKNFPQSVVIHMGKGFDIVNKVEMDVFLELSCFFDDPTNVGNFISGSSAFPKTNWTAGSSWFTYCGTLAWRILNMWDECSCAVVWAFFGIAFLWDWNENWKLGDYLKLKSQEKYSE